MRIEMKILVLVLFLALKVHCLDSSECGISSVQNYGNRIVGGREALKGEFPWMVSLQELNLNDLRYHHFCGGTLLNRHWILTAAHCLTNLDPELTQVVVGAHHLSGSEANKAGVSYHSIKKFVIHRDFSESRLQNDIALVRISGEINFKASKGLVNSICLPEEDYYLTGLVTATGWGALYNDGPISNVLLAVELPLITQEYCKTKYGYDRIKDTVFCAGYSGSGDTCQGDSGGPVIQYDHNRAITVGIVSYGNVCARSGWPAVYTEVSKYLGWIHKHIKD